MATIICSLWRGEEPNFVYGIRCPKNNLRQYHFVDVDNSQYGILLSAKGVIAKYEPGKNEINHRLIPAGKSFAGIPLGNQNPEKVELWIVNLNREGLSEFEISKLEVVDKFTKKIVPVNVRVNYSFDVVDPVKFINYYIGAGGKNISAISIYDLHRDIIGNNMMKVENTVRSFVERNGLMTTGGRQYLDALAQELINLIGNGLGYRGVRLKYLDVQEIEVETSQLSNAKKRSLSEGMGSTAVVHSRNQVASGSVPAAPSAPPPPSPGPYRSRTPGYPGDAKIIYCAQCSSKHLTTERFCPNCGNEYRPCPSCGSDTHKDAKRCVKCGAVLKVAPPPEICENCGTTLIAGTAFCPNCGAPHAEKKEESRKKCPRCKSIVPASTKFCPNCSFRL